MDAHEIKLAVTNACDTGLACNDGVVGSGQCSAFEGSSSYLFQAAHIYFYIPTLALCHQRENTTDVNTLNMH